MRAETNYVDCQGTITSPIADERGMEPDQPCPERCEVVREASAMLFRCRRGHQFVAVPADIKHVGTL